MWKFPSIRNVADLGKIWTRKKKNGLKHSFFPVTSATPSLEGKTMYMLARLMANLAISNVCIYCDLLDIINGTGKVDVADTFYQNFKKLLTLSQLYDFMKYHKEYCYNQNISHESCLREICENCVLLTKGLNTRLLCLLPTNPHELIERFSCSLMRNGLRNGSLPHLLCR